MEYVAPTLELLVFDTEDVITTSETIIQAPPSLEDDHF